MYDQTIGSTTVTTRCPNEIRDWAKKNDVKLPRILWEGYLHLSGKKKDEIPELKSEIRSLSEKLSRYARRVYELEENTNGKQQ